jgi:hypothetical protein
MTKNEDAAGKADLIARARKTANVYVTTVSKGENDTPERILYDAGSQTAAEMLAAYKLKMDTFDTIPLDIEGDIVRLYRGEWTIISGYTGTGKTTWLRQTICHLLKAGKNVFVATLEQAPEHYIIELAATAAGVEMPSEKQLQAFLDLYGAQLKLWGMIGVAEHKKILATVRDLAAAGLDYAVIDSLMMLDVDSDDFEAQRKFAALLSATVQAKNVHVILVAHPKKPMSADQEPAVQDVAGSGHLGNLTYNVHFIRRGPENPGQPNITPMELHCLKQRTRSRLGVIVGCFYADQRQFHLDAYAQQPTFYLPADCYPATGLSETIPEHIVNPAAFKVDKETGEILEPWEI